MIHFKPLILLHIIGITGLFGCVQAMSSGTQQTEQDPDRALANLGKVRADVQYSVFKRFRASPAAEAWILVTEAGFADRGQTFIFKTGSSAQYFYIPTRETEPKPSVEIKSASFSNFEKVAATSLALQDLKKPVFDGMRYEYIYLKKDAQGNPVIQKRLFIMSPGLNEPEPQYTALVESFFTIK